MSIILWIVLGAISGWIASAIMGSNRGLLGDMIVGILGALLGGWLATLMGASGITGFNLYSVLVAVLGSVVFIGVARMLSRNTPVRQ